jgi:hypothetical protein
MNAKEQTVEKIEALLDCRFDQKGYEFKDFLSRIIDQYYKARTIEILEQLDQQGLMLDDIKIGGTD